MTDARLRGEWFGMMRYEQLSDAAWRVFTSALMFSAQNGTDGYIPFPFFHKLHPYGAKPDALAELESASIWSKTDDGYQLHSWDGELGQSTAAQVETYKENARTRQRKFREKERQKLEKANSRDTVTRDVTRDVTGPVTRDVGEGIGEGERTGKGDHEVSFREQNVNLETGEIADPVTSWPVATIPADPGYCEHGMTVGVRCRKCPSGKAEAKAA